METTKIITLTFIGVIAMSTSIVVNQLILRKLKEKGEKEGILNLAYGLLIMGWIFSISLLNMKAISILAEYFDALDKTNSENIVQEITKTSILFIGLTNMWLVLWYYITQAIFLIIAGKRSDLIEMENNHYTYFLMKNMLFIGFIISLMPIFEIILRSFFPNIEIPYYR